MYCYNSYVFFLYQYVEMFYFERMRDSYCVKSGSWERLKIYIYIDKGSKD